MNINKIIYIDASVHINPTIHFPKTKEFIFIDTMPCSNTDKKKFISSSYDKNFLKELIKKYNEYDFILMEIIDINSSYYKEILNTFQKLYYTFNKLPQYINPTLCIFFNMNTNQTIRYYISTNVVYNINEMLSYDIKTSDAIIINNNFKAINIIDEPKIFLGYSNLYYDKKQYNNLNISKYFNKFYYINNITGEKIECDSLNDYFKKVNLYKMIN